MFEQLWIIRTAFQLSVAFPNDTLQLNNTIELLEVNYELQLIEKIRNEIIIISEYVAEMRTCCK